MAFIAGYILGPVSLLTLTAINVDRLLALSLGLRYRQVVTLKRTSVIVTIFWTVSIVAVTMFLQNYLIPLWYSYICVLFCLVTSIFSYTKIFNALRQHQTQVQDHDQQPSQASPLNIARYREAVSSALWVQVILVACYLPFVVDGIVSRVMPLQSELSLSYYLAKLCTITLVYSNSSLNPILYCWKIREVRQAVKDTVKQVLCCSWN